MTNTDLSQDLPQLPAAPAPLILGHRGASAIAPENTLAAFARAMQDGADGIEFDVQLSRDGVPFVIHDATLKRTAGLEGTVSSLAAKELQRIDVGTWFRKDFAGEKLPSLAQVFELLRETKSLLNVEMKPDFDDLKDLARAVVQTTRQFDFQDRVIVSSFELNAIVAVKEIDSSIRTAALFEPRLSRPVTTLLRRKMINAALAAKADEIALHHSLASSTMIKRSRAAGLEVIVWTVDDPVWFKRAQDSHIKALICNDPGTMVQARDSKP